MNEDFLSPYQSHEVEEKIYKEWEKSNLFNPDECLNQGIADESKETFSMVLPPPNVTGILHLGHSMMIAIQDTIVRFHRMNGKRTLWIPGTDHASIATQSKVEKILYNKEKKTKEDLGYDKFIKLVKDYAKESHDTITSQVKSLGASLDWSREAYTLDGEREKAVNEAFKIMYEKGIIYKGNRIVNWDPKLKTTISDDEIEWVEKKEPFYYLSYGPFEIGTTRPETKFGDKYVVMHPDDDRYKKYSHKEEIEIDWINGKTKTTIIKDSAIDKDFGSGVMTITPHHDKTDFDIAERHNLDAEQIIDDRGVLLPIAGEFSGQHIKKAREKIVEKMKEMNLYIKQDDNYVHRIATNSRGGETIEPQIKKQWFISVNKEFIDPNGKKTTLKKILKEAVENDGVNIIPNRFIKVYNHWINNLRDWCISRQIWFGHQIPIWYKGEEVYCGSTAPKEDGWTRDTDTLDTWFSSGLWTFSTLGWPEKTKDIETYHPTTLLETGYDILFFWVSRMILMSGALLGEIPFKNVYLHGLVRDEKGRKMSKSIGNIIDPIDMVSKYGADATRLSLIVGITPGNDVNLSEDKIRSYKHFANKIWNISRFVFENTENVSLSSPLVERDEKIKEEVNSLIKETTKHIENYNLHLAIEALYEYIWKRFANEIIEDSKKILSDADIDEKDKKSRQRLLMECLKVFLKLLHPFMPFVTERIWKEIDGDREFLMVEKWPTQV